MGVWIETSMMSRTLTPQAVTPFVGVWIETHTEGACRRNGKSHPSWVCGLKLLFVLRCRAAVYVTPFVGVWIETPYFVEGSMIVRGHTLRGCVD